MAYILAVDDDPGVLGLIAEILRRDGHTVVTAPDAFRALDALNLQEPDLVLTGIRMPEVDGYGLCRAIRRYHPNLPVVAITAESIDSDAFDAVIIKPFRITDLVTTVTDMLTRVPRSTIAQPCTEDPA